MAIQNSPYFIGPEAQDTSKRQVSDGELPVISMGLDSVRAYQFEMHFRLPKLSPSDPDAETKLTLACKQVSQAGFTVEDIEVHRVNDKVFYPGKASPEELTVTFDNLYQPKVSNTLWQWFSYIYDPTNGKFLTEIAGPTGSPMDWKSPQCTLVSLDAQGQPLMETRLFGVYPKSWKTAEFNYATNEFHTIEVVFRYDFMEHVSQDAEIGSSLTSI